MLRSVLSFAIQEFCQPEQYKWTLTMLWETIYQKGQRECFDVYLFMYE